MVGYPSYSLFIVQSPPLVLDGIGYYILIDTSPQAYFGISNAIRSHQSPCIITM